MTAYTVAFYEDTGEVLRVWRGARFRTFGRGIAQWKIWSATSKRDAIAQFAAQSGLARPSKLSAPSTGDERR